VANRSVVWLENTGEKWADEVLRVVEERLDDGDIGHVVIATTSGNTGARFTEALRGRDVDVVCVTHHVGFKGGDENQLEPKHARAIREGGGKILTTSHALSGVARSISKGFGGTTPVEVIAQTLRLFGQGTKVCVEIAVMAADAGLIPTDRDVICVGGTGCGADTAVVLRPAHANSFFDLRIRETLCRPIA
jgi:hypothetical protein